MGFWVHSLGFGVGSVQFGVNSTELWARTVGFWVSSVGCCVHSVGLWVHSVGFWVHSVGFGVHSVGFEVQSVGFWVSAGAVGALGPLGAAFGHQEGNAEQRPELPRWGGGLLWDRRPWKVGGQPLLGPFGGGSGSVWGVWG